MPNTPSLRQTYADDLRFLVPETEREALLVQAIQRLAESTSYNRPVVKFSEAALPGQQVHLFDDAGEITARLAEAVTPYYAFGFVSAANPVSVGETAEVTLLGNNLYQSALIPGEVRYLSNTPGETSVIPGTNEQFVGLALSDGTLFQNFGTGFAGRFGTVVGPIISQNNGLVLFDGITGRTIKEATGTGYVNLTSGVATVLSADNVRDELFGGGLNSKELARRAGGSRSFSVDTTIVATDSGSTLLHPSSDTSARTITIPANATVAFPISTRIRIINQTGAGVLTIPITSDTLQFLGGGTGTRTLAANGYADIEKISATVWIITGLGIT